METNKEEIMEKVKRPTSATRYPKRMPTTYVVAFAVQETLDDPQKVEQITNKLSTDSTNSIKSSQSISPTDSTSTKTFTISPTEKLSSVLVDITTLSEVKIDIVDENQCGDITENKSNQFSSNVVINQKTTDKQPEIIFHSPKNFKRCKENNNFPRKKPRKNTVRKAQYSVHFKYKKSKNSITRRLEKYYENAKLNTPNSDQIQTQIYCNDLSQVVSRSRVLQKVLAKENLLADAEQIPSHDDVNFEYDDDSLSSSPTQSKKSFISYTSQKTLVYKESLPSRNDEEYSSPKTANCIIQGTSDKQRSFKSEVINVSLAINGSNKYGDQIASGSSNERLMHKENLTSSETILQNYTTGLTSKPTSSDEPKSFEIDYNDLSSITLIQKDKSNDTITEAVIPVVERYSEDDNFVIAQTSSDFNKSNIASNCTFQIKSGSTVPSENVQSSLPINDNFSNDISKNTIRLDRVKTLGFYPTKSPSIDSGSNNPCEPNDVLVTDNIKNSLSFTRDTTNISIDHPIDTKITSVLRKPVEMKNMTYFQNNLVLPDHIVIKAKLNAKEEIKRSCADNVRNPTASGDMWERVAGVLDLAIKRLEDTLVDKIINELRESLAALNQPRYKVTTEVHRATTTAPFNLERPIRTMENKEIFVKEELLKRDVDVCVQCDLVQKQVIDQLMYQLSLVSKPIPASEEALKILKPPELVKHYTEVLKPPVAHVTDSVSAEEGKGDTVTVSTATTELSAISSFRHIKRLFSCPMEVLRENSIILTSVPAFFVVLFCLYGVIVILMKPW